MQVSETGEKYTGRQGTTLSAGSLTGAEEGAPLLTPGGQAAAGRTRPVTRASFTYRSAAVVPA